jgi:hypothetical protein
LLIPWHGELRAGGGGDQAVHVRANLFTFLLNFTFPGQLFVASSFNSDGHFKLHLLHDEIRQMYNFALLTLPNAGQNDV